MARGDDITLPIIVMSCHFVESRSRIGFIRHSTLWLSFIDDLGDQLRLQITTRAEQSAMNLGIIRNPEMVLIWDPYRDTFQFNRITAKWPVLVVIELRECRYYVRESVMKLLFGHKIQFIGTWTSQGVFYGVIFVVDKTKPRGTARGGCCTAQFLVNKMRNVLLLLTDCH